ncbi:hypothetical protein [Shewanella saliphila]|uniref:Uncharacterized protein n=1 Tax=Shewanella saliphila TaxID=2282698 RepID=A0ABQ2Q267_9GAMM|nr:hypothetical protein [Shewanella saliphila]MCL1099935.1 hypothetical protein [Shewanella saliphila]GGP42957.1 hypothetical protein GCM10009409_07170 [Shewanella saliphila]
MMMTVLKTIGVLVGIISSLLVFGVVCLVAINASDRTKSPNTLLVESWLQQQPVVSDANGFEYAKTIVGTTEDNTSLEQKSLLTLSTEEVELTRGFKTACYQTDITTCNQFINDNDNDIKDVISAYNAQIGQYNTLLSMPFWQESDQSLTLQKQIHWSKLFQLRDLSILAAVKGVNATVSNIDIDSVTTFLDRDAHFWNNVYHSSRSLMSHTIAHNMLKLQLNLASSITPESKEFSKKISTWQSPFVLTQSDFERLFSGEWLFGRNIMQQMEIEAQQESAPFYEQWLAKMFIKTIDDDNLRAEYFVNMVKKPVSTDASVTLIQPEYCDNDNSLLQLWQLRYNPIGKVLSCTFYETDLKLRIVNMNNEIEQLRSKLIMTQ